MIEYLKIEIVPVRFAETEFKELRITVEECGKEPLEKRQIIEPDDLVSFFDRIWECAGKEVLIALKGRTLIPEKINA